MGPIISIRILLINTKNPLIPKVFRINLFIEPSLKIYGAYYIAHLFKFKKDISMSIRNPLLKFICFIHSLKFILSLFSESTYCWNFKEIEKFSKGREGDSVGNVIFYRIQVLFELANQRCAILRTSITGLFEKKVSIFLIV